MQQDSNNETRKSEDEIHIFINNVDSFNGKHILSHVYKQGFNDVAPLKEPDEMSNSSSNENVSIPAERIEKFTTYDEENHESKISLTIDQIINLGTQGPTNVSKYKIFGSMITPTKQKPEELFEVTAETHEQFRNILISCNCVIYDISQDDTQIVKALLALSIIEQDIERRKFAASNQSCPPVLFILISTCMTWALTPRIDASDPDPVPFDESDHRKRKPHPNFKEHYECEKEVMKKGKKLKGKLRTVILCSGTTYGYEENTLAFFFKKAWSNDSYLPVFGKGNNFVPLIHVSDLAQVICKLIATPTPLYPYILAVEQTPTSLKYIVKYISRMLGSGKIEYVGTEEAFLYPDIDQAIFDTITADIVMEPEYIVSSLGITWQSEMNFVENMESIVEEFKTSRGLEPLKIVILGPPCSGKTKLARLLCEHYNLHSISVKSILDNFEKKQNENNSRFTGKTTSRVGKRDDLTDINLEEIEALSDQQEMEELLGEYVHDSEEENYQRMVIEEYKKYIPKEFFEKPVRFSDEYLSMLLRYEMMKNQSQNLGFVVDGFPKTTRQAKLLFNKKSNRLSIDSDDSTTLSNKYDKKLIPSYLIYLDASNEFLLDRISRVPEEAIQNSHYNEKDMVRRLMTHRKNNTSESGTLSYFSNSDTEIIDIDVSEFPSQDMDCIFYICTKIIGKPQGFGLSTTDLTQYRIIKEYQEKLRQEKEELQIQLQKQIEKEEFDEKMKAILEKSYYDKVKFERMLYSKIDKYRTFMSNKILPFLFQSITAVIEKKPEDPVDFLAQYLFMNNPNGYMYRPGDEKFKKNSKTQFQD